MIRFGAALPSLRRHVAADLRAGEEPTRDRVLACAVRLLDVGLFRIGGEEYAEEGGGLGLATIGRRHVRVDGEVLTFDYPAKSGVRRVHAVADADCAGVIEALRWRRGETLLAHRDGRRWVALRSDDITDYLKARIGEEFSAKDFRTWNATVLAAVALAAPHDPLRSEGARRRAIDAAVRTVAQALGNTPASRGARTSTRASSTATARGGRSAARCRAATAPRSGPGRARGSSGRSSTC